MADIQSLRIFFLVLSSVPSLASAGGVYNILYFGARPGGHTDSTKALLGAWSAACRSPSPATVRVPSGRFLVGQAAMSGPCHCGQITVQIDGTLVAPSAFSDAATWITFDGVDGLSVIGGTVDGQGAAVWKCKSAGHGGCPGGATSLQFTDSRRVTVSGLTSVNSQLYHIVIKNCQDVQLRGVKISAPGDSPNTDGIHVQGSTDVTVTGSAIATGDDCISIGAGAANLWIEGVSCGPGHGISIGSLGKKLNEPGVQNVTVKTTVFRGTQNGLRIKTWGRPSQGFVKGVRFEDATMVDVCKPIVVDQNYCPHEVHCPGKSSGVKISQVAYSGIHGSSASLVAVDFSCSPTNPCSGIELRDIDLTYDGNKTAEASCKNAGGRCSGVVIPASCLSP